MPIPYDELERVLMLSELNLDYSSLNNNFRDLARLAARVSGTEISLVNLIDTYTQWTISYHGLEVAQIDREESACQYTIAQQEFFEVRDMTQDERFRDKFYVVGDPNIKYYFGVPLKLQGYNIGALCVLDKQVKTLTPEKVDLLKIIADEITNRLSAYKLIEALKHKVAETQSIQNKVIHDIRGPLSGIVGLAEFIHAQGNKAKIDDVLDLVTLIHKSGNSILELADEILSAESGKTERLKSDELSLLTFKEKLNKLYIPQAKNKNIDFTVTTSAATEEINFPKNKLLQIAGNLISNAIKFTPQNGCVSAALRLDPEAGILNITVSDNGIGISHENIENILGEHTGSTKGTEGEKGYGFGLQLVTHLVRALQGSIRIVTESGTPGTMFIVELPFKQANA